MPTGKTRAGARATIRAEVEEIALARDNDLLVTATITAAAFVARADGWVDPAERDRLITWMDEANLLEGLSGSDVAASFDLRLRQFAEPGGIFAAVETLRRAAHIVDARLVLIGATQVARADGRVQVSELNALSLVRRTLFPVNAAYPAMQDQDAA